MTRHKWNDKRTKTENQWLKRNQEFPPSICFRMFGFHFGFVYSGTYISNYIFPWNFISTLFLLTFFRRSIYMIRRKRRNRSCLERELDHVFNEDNKTNFLDTWYEKLTISLCKLFIFLIYGIKFDLQIMNLT